MRVTCCSVRWRSSKRSARSTVPTARVAYSPASPPPEAAASPARHESLPPHIGGAEQRSITRIDAGERRARIYHEWPQHDDRVAEPPERVHQTRCEAVLDLPDSWGEAMPAAALAILRRVEARSL